MNFLAGSVHADDVNVLCPTADFEQELEFWLFAIRTIGFGLELDVTITFSAGSSEHQTDTCI